MSQHYTRNTVSASSWCRKCNGFTPHRIDDARIGPCLTCLERLTAASQVKPEPKTQFEMFEAKGTK